MPQSDLTPQLRTSLTRLERVIGLFLGVAALLMVAGLGFYLYRVSEREGWFLQKMPYFTFVRNAAGLKVGDPVKMMGFPAGEITSIEPQPAEDRYFDVFVGFRIRQPYYGYLWENSRAKIVAADLLGNRYIEVTKGTNGPSTYVFFDLEEVTLDQAAQLSGPHYLFGQDVYDAKDNLVVRVGEPLSTVTLEKARSAGLSKVVMINKSDDTRRADGIWDYQQARYVPLTNGSKGYFLVPEESVPVTERAEQLVQTVELAMPNVLRLTNQLNRLLGQAADAAERADRLLADAQPALAHINRITRNLTNSQGSLGDWLFTTNMAIQLTQTLAGANLVLANTDRRMEMLTTNLTEALGGLDLTLVNLANITSNLHAQVNANTNLVSDVSRLIVDADKFVQGLKRHWLLRSAFKEKPATTPSSQEEFRRTQSPKALEQ